MSGALGLISFICKHTESGFSEHSRKNKQGFLSQKAESALSKFFSPTFQPYAGFQSHSYLSPRSSSNLESFLQVSSLPQNILTRVENQACGRSRKSRNPKEHSVVPRSLGTSASPKLPIIYFTVGVQRKEEKISTQDSKGSTGWEIFLLQCWAQSLWQGRNFAPMSPGKAV